MRFPVRQAVCLSALLILTCTFSCKSTSPQPNGIAPAIEIITPQTGLANQTSTFSAVVANTHGNESYAWSFGGGANPNTATGPSAAVILMASGTYSGTLTVTNDYGIDTQVFIYTVSTSPAPPPPPPTSPLIGWWKTDTTMQDYPSFIDRETPFQIRSTAGGHVVRVVVAQGRPDITLEAPVTINGNALTFAVSTEFGEGDERSKYEVSLSLSYASDRLTGNWAGVEKLLSTGEVTNSEGGQFSAVRTSFAYPIPGPHPPNDYEGSWITQGFAAEFPGLDGEVEYDIVNDSEQGYIAKLRVGMVVPIVIVEVPISISGNTATLDFQYPENTAELDPEDSVYALSLALNRTGGSISGTWITTETRVSDGSILDSDEGSFSCVRN